MVIFDIDECEKKIGYSFKDKMLLRKCFTHASYANEHSEKDNELLEFFGDSIMEFIVTEYLYNTGKGDEGEMTRERAKLVSKQPLLNTIKRMRLNEFVLLGNGLVKNTGQDEKLFSSIYEALVAGIYIDGGIAPAKKFIYRTLIENYESERKKQQKPIIKSVYKVQLQEYVQKNKLGVITYQAVSKSGPDHQPEFKEAVLLNGKVVGQGKGKSRQSAQNEAASIALKRINKQGR